jgi:hypothetical protein
MSFYYTSSYLISFYSYIFLLLYLSILTSFYSYIFLLLYLSTLISFYSYLSYFLFLSLLHSISDISSSIYTGVFTLVFYLFIHKLSFFLFVRGLSFLLTFYMDCLSLYSYGGYLFHLFSI